MVLTSFSEQRWITDALEAGAEGYLLKQSEPEVILAGIREVVRGRRAAGPEGRPGPADQPAVRSPAADRRR